MNPITSALGIKSLRQDTLLVDVDVYDKSRHCLLDLQSFLPPALYLSKLKSL